MDENRTTDNEQKLSSIIDSYDGDPDEILTFKRPDESLYVEDEEDAEDFADDEPEYTWSRDDAWEEEEDYAEQLKPKEPETVWERPEDGFTPEDNPEDITEELKNPNISGLDERGVPIVNGGKTGGSSGKVEGTIDLKDPHYKEFTLDPYYDFGMGAEPKQPRVSSGGQVRSKARGFAIASLSCGIASFTGMCCSSISVVTAICAIVFGCIALGRKDEIDGGAKGMAITGIILGGLSLLVKLAYMVMVLADGFSSFGSSFNTSFSTSYP